MKKWILFEMKSRPEAAKALMQHVKYTHAIIYFTNKEAQAFFFTNNIVINLN